MRVNMKSSVSLTLKRGDSPVKVNQGLCVPHTEKGGSLAQVQPSHCFPHTEKGGSRLSELDTFMIYKRYEIRCIPHTEKRRNQRQK